LIFIRYVLFHLDISAKAYKYQQTGFNFQDLNSNFNELPEKMQNNWITNNAKEYLL